MIGDILRIARANKKGDDGRKFYFLCAIYVIAQRAISLTIVTLAIWKAIEILIDITKAGQ